MPDSMNEYQTRCHYTAVYPQEIALAYVALGLAGEAGEIANKVKKLYRDGDGCANELRRDQLADELGDVLWYVAEFAAQLGMPLAEIADRNLRKLQDRALRNAIQGEGDRR